MKFIVEFILHKLKINPGYQNRGNRCLKVVRGL
jgi:hypothetical protein